MIDKLRKKLNNSASLGKTMARNQHNFSHFAQPKQFDLRSLNESRQYSKKQEKKSFISTPKISAPKAVPANLFIGDNLIKIQLNRQKCVKIGKDVHIANADKNLRLNKMYKDIHHFSICIDQLKWLLNQGDNLIRTYLNQVSLLAPNSAHTLDVSNIAQQFRSLVLRFAHIEKNKLIGISDYLKLNEIQKNSQHLNAPFFDNLEKNQIRPFPQLNQSFSSKYKQKENEINSFLETRHFSVPLKQNINNSNVPHFDNIKILKSQTNKNKQTTSSKHISAEVKQIQLQKKIEELNNKLKNQSNKNQKLINSSEILSEQISNLERKILKYKVASDKSISKFSQILNRLLNHLTEQEKQFQLLKMAQCIKNWQKILEDEKQEAKYREIYGNPEYLQSQKTKKFQQIIELQYEINNLLGQRQYLQKIDNFNSEKQIVNNSMGQVFYRMLLTQALTLEQVCNL